MSNVKERFMKKLFAALLVLLSMTILSYADSIRCSNKLAKTGDAKAYVLDICGQPISDDLVAWENDIAIHHVAYKENGNIKILVFKGGILTTIMDAKK